MLHATDSIVRTKLGDFIREAVATVQ